MDGAREHRSGGAWRSWYKTARWRRLRMEVFVRDLFKCSACPRIEADTSQLVCDHILPHRGSEALFWELNNLQTLCKRCHDGAKQRGEQSSLHQRGVWH